MEPIFLAADTTYGLAFLVASVLAALQTQRDLRVAKPLVLIGVAIMGIRWGAWALTTDAGWPVRAVVGAIIGAALFALVPSALHWLNERLSPAPQHETKSSAYILADCYMSAYPSERPQNGEMYALIVPPNAAEILTIAVVPWVQPSRPTFEDLYKCDLAVKGDLPIFNVTISFKFVVREFLPNSGTTGETLATKEMAIFVRKIDVYPAIFSVYMEDRAGYWTLVEPVAAYSKSGPADAAVFIDVKTPTKTPLGPMPQASPAVQGTDNSESRRPFYSKRDKDNLNDLCRDLAGFLRRNGGDGGGDGVWKHIATLANDWIAARNSDSQNVDSLIQELPGTRESVQLYWEGLYGDGSFFKKYDTYREELNGFFGSNYTEEIGNLQLAVGEFATSIVALQSETNTESRQRLFRALEPSHEKYEQTIAKFQKHMHEITQHVEAFRKQL